MILVALCLGPFAVVVDATTVNVALSSLVADLHARPRPGSVDQLRLFVLGLAVFSALRGIHVTFAVSVISVRETSGIIVVPWADSIGRRNTGVLD